MSFWGLFSNATLIVKLIMFSLLILSVVSWSLIFQRTWFMRDAQRSAEQFEDQFWSGSDLGKVYDGLNVRGKDASGLALIFQSGFKEYLRLRKQSTQDPSALLEGVQRTMRVAMSREADKVEAHLTFLATVGSISPYIGLFGTVWGIMNAFMALGNVQQATLSLVAPGIAEALVATAMGLFAAIPAVVAYNRFANVGQRLLNRYETFQEEFSTILHRQVHASNHQPVAG